MQLGEVEEERSVDKFIRGLKSKTRTELELRDPQTLEEAGRIADRFDIIVYPSTVLRTLAILLSRRHSRRTHATGCLAPGTRRRSGPHPD